MIPGMRAPILIALGLLLAGPEALAKVSAKQVSASLLGGCFHYPGPADWDGIGAGSYSRP